MNRDIKFRGKRVDNGEWVYGYYVKELCGTVYILADEGYQWDSQTMLSLVEIDEETVGQYTGLKDKNGVEIYEGDVVEFTLTIKLSPKKIYSAVEQRLLKCEVAYNDDRFCLKETDGTFSAFHKIPSKTKQFGTLTTSDAKVIGNIHESEVE